MMAEVPPHFYYNVCFGAVGVITSASCLFFIIRKLKINGLIKNLLLFANVQQLIGYNLFLVSRVLQYIYNKNKWTCYLAFVSIGSTMKTTQLIISMISVIR